MINIDVQKLRDAVVKRIDEYERAVEENYQRKLAEWESERAKWLVDESTSGELKDQLRNMIELVDQQFVLTWQDFSNLAFQRLFFQYGDKPMKRDLQSDRTYPGLVALRDFLVTLDASKITPSTLKSMGFSNIEGLLRQAV